MASFDSLTASVQNVVNFSYTESSKVFILGFFFILSLLYLFYLKKFQRPTVLLSTKFFRFYTTPLAFIFLFFSPYFIIINLAPQVDFWDMFTIFFTFIYSLFLTIYLVLLSLDIFRFGFMGFLLIIGVKYPGYKKDLEEAKKFIPERFLGVIYGKRHN